MAEKKPRVLIADDEEALLSALGEYLGCCGYDVRMARRPCEASELLSSMPFEVVVTDLRFFGPDGAQGLEIARVARQRSPGGRVLLLTAYRTPEAESAARVIGVEEILDKPIPLWELAQKIMRDAPVH